MDQRDAFTLSFVSSFLSRDPRPFLAGLGPPLDCLLGSDSLYLSFSMRKGVERSGKAGRTLSGGGPLAGISRMPLAECRSI